MGHREIERRSIVRHADADSAHACRITRNQCSSVAPIGCFESYVNRRRRVPLIADPIAVKAVGSSQQNVPLASDAVAEATNVWPLLVFAATGTDIFVNA